MKKITTVAVVDALGGTHAVVRLFKTSSRVVYNWRRNGKFPANTYVVLQQELKRRKLQAPDTLWAMRFPKGRK